ncbi:MAG: hotdog domain-containing protein [Planctomycetota bacterium]
MNSETRQPAIRVILLPKDTNERGTIFGGVILSQLDLAGAVEARKHTEHKFVTVAMKEVEFVAPVYVGDVVSFYTETVRRGRTSVTVQVSVEAQRRKNSDETVRVTEAEVVYVAVNEDGQPIPWDSPES